MIDRSTEFPWCDVCKSYHLSPCDPDSPYKRAPEVLKEEAAARDRAQYRTDLHTAEVIQRVHLEGGPGVCKCIECVNA